MTTAAPSPATVDTLAAGEGSSLPRLLVVCRSDGQTKPGGDVSLLRTFGNQLQGTHEVLYTYGVPSRSEIATFDAVLAANLDRPVEPAETLRRAQAEQVPFLLYALHHPYEGVEEYLRKGAIGFRAALARVGRFSPQSYEQLLWAVHMSYQAVRNRVRPYPWNVRDAQNLLLGESTKVVVSSDAEAAAISAEVAQVCAYEVVPHPRDHLAIDWSPVDGRIIVPGRIESRKNQKLALEIAPHFPDHEFHFVGAPLESDRRYADSVLAKIDELANCRYIANLPKDEFYHYLATAQAVFSGSWFEVTSLIELQCVEIGIPLAVSRYSYLENGDRICKHDPASKIEAAAALSRCLRMRSAGLPPRPSSDAMPASFGKTLGDVLEAL